MRCNQVATRVRKPRSPKPAARGGFEEDWVLFDDRETDQWPLTVYGARYT
jgi:hypothetical protein